MEAEVEATPGVEVVDTTEVMDEDVAAPVEEPPVVEAFEPVDVEAAVAQESSTGGGALERVKDEPVEEAVVDNVEVADEVIPAEHEAPAVDKIADTAEVTGDVVPEAALEAVTEDEQAIAEVGDLAEGDVAPPVVEDSTPPADLSEAVEEKDEGMADIIAEGKAATATGGAYVKPILVLCLR
uniref:Uncharacterized protein n=1 Tax=Rhodosorus marinus TaxID=101924 RepID=A0A7S0BRS0_9RHOD|mmetsp:Transcript_4856/g.6762  ORF Transcript_4856/g.6762 Transcript_4856/m.6762 type:complete len:182 (+) Transcript_4856:135-680(+)